MRPSGSVKKAVFLDRDGVINRVFLRGGIPYPPKNVRELEINSGVKEAISILYDAGYELVVVTNQPEIARGTLKINEINQIHCRIAEQTGLRHFLTCVHDDVDLCACRKPKPGLLLEASKTFRLDLKKSFLVGDRWKDIQAGQTVGCSCFFIDDNYQEKRPSRPFNTVASLLEAATQIMENDFANSFE